MRSDPLPLVDRARLATAAVFGVSGLAFASWVARIPAVRDALSLSTQGIALVLLSVAVGSLLALAVAGHVVHAFGTARSVLVGAGAVATGLAVAAAGVRLSGTPIVMAGLLVMGTGISLWDVGMNVEGVAVERRLARPLLPRLHAGFSLGTVFGALGGAACAHLDVPVPVQFLLTSVLVAGSVAVAVRHFLAVEAPDAGAQVGGSGAARAWREPRTLALGLLVLAFAFTEGSANDWVTVAIVDGHDGSEALGALGFACFVAAMTVARFTGGSALSRYGRVAVLRASAGLAAIGLLAFVLGGPLPVVLLGAVLWGAGAALGFPVGMSAAAEDDQHAPARVAVVSAIGYTAFLAGPPLVGLIGERFGLLRALLVVLVAAGVALVASAAARPRSTADTSRSDV